MYLAVLMVLVLMAVTLFTSGTDSESSTMGYSQVVSYFKANQVTGFALDLNTGVIKLSLKQGDVELPDTTAANQQSESVLQGVLTADRTNKVEPLNGGEVVVSYKIPYLAYFVNHMDEYIDSYDAANPSAPMVYDIVGQKTSFPWAEILMSGLCMGCLVCILFMMFRGGQGGSVMNCSENISGTLRAQEHGHQPLVFDNHGQDTRFCGPVDCAQTISASFGEGGNNQPLVYENHGIDARYTGPHPVVPTLSARAGTGGNNLPLVEQEPAETFCITGNAIDRQPQNGGNGIGYQEDVSYTLTATDHHAVFSRQRADKFSPSDVASTESARQYKDATDLIHQAAGTGPPQLIRRLTPLECERLQGFPDGWTDLPGASDSARYRALGNSVAIPCVEFIMRGVIIAAGYSA